MNKILSVGVLALALTLGACNKSNNQNGVDDSTARGTTYMSISLTIPSSSGLRAATTEDNNNNGIGQWKGRDEIESIDVYMISEGSVEVERRTVITKTTQATSTVNGIYQTDAWKTTPGQKKIYVVVNNGGDVKTALDAADAVHFDSEYRKAYAMTTGNNTSIKEEYSKASQEKDKIIMSGEPVGANIVKGVKADAAKTKDSSNNVKVNVRRATARVAVTMKQDLATANDADGVQVSANRKSTAGGTAQPTKIGVLKGLKWTVAQFEKTSYLCSLEGKIAPADVKSPHWNYVPTTTEAYNSTTAGDYYSYDLIKERYKIAGFTRNTGDNTANINAIVKTDMKFITETTHQYGHVVGSPEGSKPESQYRRGNTTYVMVVGTFVPEDNKFATGEREKYHDGQNLYLGTIDGLFYSDLETAKTANKTTTTTSDKDNVITFTGGQMYYFAWVNPDNVESGKWANSPVIRNNIYHINIAGFKKLGFSGNPFNPNTDNPNKPDPDDPTPNPQDPINEEDTYMATEVTVINWGAHSYDVEF